jgi:hypothetical protein
MMKNEDVINVINGWIVKVVGALCVIIIPILLVLHIRWCQKTTSDIEDLKQDMSFIKHQLSLGDKITRDDK